MIQSQGGAKRSPEKICNQGAPGLILDIIPGAVGTDVGDWPMGEDFVEEHWREGVAAQAEADM